MSNTKFGAPRIFIFFSIIVLVGLAVSSKLIYTELQASIQLSDHAKIRLKALSQLNRLNSAITYIERNEKPKLIAQNSNSIFEIHQGFALAKNALDSIKQPQFQMEIFPFEIDSLSNFIEKKYQLSNLVIKLSLINNPDSAISILKNSNDSLLVRNFYISYNTIYNRIRKELDSQLENHISDATMIYEILWIVIFITFSVLLFSIIKISNQLKIKNDLLLKNKTFLDIIEFSSDSIMTLDLNLIITYCNKATEDLFKLARKDIIGKIPEVQFRTQGTQEEINERRLSIRKYGFWMGELKCMDANDQIIELHMTLNSFKDLRGNSIGYFSIQSNITKLVHAQNEIKVLAESLYDANKSLKDQVKVQTTLINDVFERVQEVFIGTDRELKINYASKHIDSIFGIKSDSLHGMDVKEFLLKIAGPEYVEIPRTAFETNQNNNFDFKNEETGYWFEGNVYPSKNGISLYFQDITEKVKSKEENLKSQRMFEFLSKANENILTAKNANDLFQNICDLTLTLDDIIFTWIGAPENMNENIVALKWAGKEDGYLSAMKFFPIKEALAGRGPSGKAFREEKVYYCNDIGNDIEMDLWREEALKRGYRSSISLPIKVDSKITYVFTLYTSKPNYFKEDHIELLINITDNISFALQAFYTADLKKAADIQLIKVLKAIEQSSASVIITDLNGNIEYVNPAFSNLTGYSFEEVLGQNPSILKTDYTTPEEISHLWEKISHNQEWAGEFCNKKKNGELFWDHAVISPVLNEAGVITNYVSVQENVTTQKNLQADQLKLTEDLVKRNHDLEKFSYILSHNIRGPLSNILGLRDALKREHAIGIEPSLLQAISDSADSMDQVIREVSQVISSNQVSMEEKVVFNFEKLLGSVKVDLEQFINEKQAVIESDFSKAPTFNSIASYFNSILYHLITNALKFSKKGIAPRIQIWTESRDDKTYLHVKDYGIGIDLDRYGKVVFDLYKRFNFNVEGRGVGLYLVKSQVKFLGGDIEIKSELGMWTEFIICLPNQST
ncbi:MAG: PAS domain-containing protein [Bacteroidota bacterium]